MDFLLKGEELKFSIDEIYKKNDNLYCVKIIPEIKSEYFPPYHTREINIDKMLLEKKFYYAYNKKLEFYDNIQNRENVDEKYIKDESVFQGSVVQGGYYSIKTSNIRDIGIFKKDTIITSQNDIFKGNKIESPYDNVATNNNILKIDKGFELLSKGSIGDELDLYLYCFNVGQGDSFLLITTNKNAYLIDTNISNNKNAEAFYEEVRNILKLHEITKISAFVVTHKHLDHIRGADKFISESKIKIDNFLINLDYLHPTKVVSRLLEQANLHIPKWININSTGVIKDGDTEIIFKNPDETTSTKQMAPDINDSSIVFCVKYRKTIIYLTGDASYGILNKKLYNCRCYEFLKKYLHHERDTEIYSELVKDILYNCNDICRYRFYRALIRISHHEFDIERHNELLKSIIYNCWCRCKYRYYKSLIKISHHGSDTGTNDELLDNIIPQYAFISAGNNKRLNHPHPDIINLLENKKINITISKKERRTVCYKSDGYRITKI
ncbi:ComEC/Rec2 family competence protein [Intestinibacter bartlettii]|uniref:ComEC/Rec2 family competence protein n=1 Tax=Intestinibacter bartlettii TaxID=261299 RepID=UPI002676B339|nr:MBL fold metallo-hydrolase [Intestinibacter bartlettii]